MSQSTKMLSGVTTLGVVNSSGDGPNYIAGVLHPQMQKDRSGIIFVSAGAAGLTGSVKVQGRACASTPVGGAMPWLDILTITQADWANPDNTFAKVITMFPEMQLVANITVGAPNLSAWIIE